MMRVVDNVPDLATCAVNFKCQVYCGNVVVEQVEDIFHTHNMV